MSLVLIKTISSKPVYYRKKVCNRKEMNKFIKNMKLTQRGIINIYSKFTDTVYCYEDKDGVAYYITVGDF